MSELLGTPLFGLALTLTAYSVGLLLRRRWPIALFHPLLVAAVLVIAVILLTPLTLEQYQVGGGIITAMIAPATAALALQIYQNRKVLLANFLPVVLGCLAGCITSIVSVLGLCRLFGLDQVLTASLVPKSVTTAIAIDLAEMGGGLTAVTVAAVIITGNLLAMVGPVLIRVLKLNNKVAVGTAMGTAGHAVATAKAVELGEAQGAISGVAIGVAGVLTTVMCIVLFSLV